MAMHQQPCISGAAPACTKTKRRLLRAPTLPPNAGTSAAGEDGGLQSLGGSRAWGAPPASPSFPASHSCIPQCSSLGVKSTMVSEDGEGRGDRMGSLLSCCLRECHHFPPAYPDASVGFASVPWCHQLWSASSGERRHKSCKPRLPFPKSWGRTWHQARGRQSLSEGWLLSRREGKASVRESSFFWKFSRMPEAFVPSVWSIWWDLQATFSRVLQPDGGDCSWLWLTRVCFLKSLC